MARERGLAVDTAGFEAAMQEQKDRSRGARVTEVITAKTATAAEADPYADAVQTEFVGYVRDTCIATVEEIREDGGNVYAVVNRSPFYAEMGGQVGDSGYLLVNDTIPVPIANTVQRGPSYFLRLASKPRTARRAPGAAHHAGDRRRAPPRHRDAPHRDPPAPLGVARGRRTRRHPEGQLRRAGPAAVRFQQRGPHPGAGGGRGSAGQPAVAGQRPGGLARGAVCRGARAADIMQFFGDKYGENVRVVQIGGNPGALDGYSMELCAGTHVRATGQLGAFKIVSEGAIAAGVRRIEAVAGLAALNYFQEQVARRDKRVEELEAKLAELSKAQEKDKADTVKRDADAFVDAALPKVDAAAAVPRIVERVPVGAAGAEMLAAIAETLKGAQVQGRGGAGGRVGRQDGATAGERVAGVYEQVQRGQIVAAVGAGGRGQGRRQRRPRARRGQGTGQGQRPAQEGSNVVGVESRRRRA